MLLIRISKLGEYLLLKTTKNGLVQILVEEKPLKEKYYEISFS